MVANCTYSRAVYGIIEQWFGFKLPAQNAEQKYTSTTDPSTSIANHVQSGFGWCSGCDGGGQTRLIGCRPEVGMEGGLEEGAEARRRATVGDGVRGWEARRWTIILPQYKSKKKTKDHYITSTH
jgi:hypothetical protein